MEAERGARWWRPGALAGQWRLDGAVNLREDDCPPMGEQTVWLFFDLRGDLDGRIKDLNV